MAAPFTRTLDHLGLVAGFCQSIKLADVVDNVLGGKSSQHNISNGQLLVAMIINGLGFTGRTLHMYGEFFKNKPTDRLIGEDVLPEHINDDALGRCLDSLFDYGVSSLYQHISEAVIKHLGLSVEGLHLDSTSFHYDGKATTDEDFNHIHITKGYSRDHRPELNQVILNLICENQAGIPVYMKPASGNTNDKEGFKQIVKSHIQSLKTAHNNRYLVADSALYTEETIANLHKQNQLFITRVPQAIKEANMLIKQAPLLTLSPITEGYAGIYKDSEYGGVPQKWLLIRSEQAYKREQHNLDKRMLKAGEEARKSFKQLCQQRFACAVDAEKALKKWLSKQKVCRADAKIVEQPIYSSAGRPKKGEQPIRIEHAITGVLFTPLSSREEALQQLGLFIIATNDLNDSVSMETLLNTYKAQQNVERGFRFLKSPDFLTSGIFLKKEERIEALLMVMTCCLMVYAALEHQIRTKLVETSSYFPDMKNKPSQKPTARWVFQCFDGISIVYLPDIPSIVTNIEERNRTIIDCLGPEVQRIYS